MTKGPKTIRLAVAILAAAVLLSGCGNGDNDAETATNGAVSVQADDLFYEPDSLSAPAGQITFTMENVGDAEHDLIVDEAGDVEIIGLVAPGETGSGSIELEPGTYTLYCDVPGHREAGMEATLTVN